MDALENLNKLLSGGMLSKPNADRVTRIFRDAARLVYERQKRLNKVHLRMRDISSALILADFIHSDAFRFEVRGELAVNLGECPEEDAIRYYEGQVMGVVADKFGRQIRIDEEGMRAHFTRTGNPASTSLLRKITRRSEVSGSHGFGTQFKILTPFVSQRIGALMARCFGGLTCTLRLFPSPSRTGLKCLTMLSW